MSHSLSPLDDRATRDQPAPPLIGQLILEQRQSWHRGQRVLVEELLQRHPSQAVEKGALLDLIYHEMLLRGEHGEPARIEEYRSRFPDLVDLLAPHLPAESPSPISSPGNGAVPSVISSQGGVYQLQEVLGRGGMAVVYRARQLGLNRVVALKMLAATGGEAAVARFRTEAEAAGRLRHPNIVQVYEVGEHEGRPFFSMEFVSGGSLDRRLAGAPQPARAAAELVETLARALHAVHQAGIVHRDLKPANILLSPTTDETAPASSRLYGEPRITDFGVARLLDAEAELTRTGSPVGTPSYMAPEQAAGRSREAGPAVDVWALGAILYEMLTGRPPFRAETALATLQLVQSTDPVPSRRLQPGVPRDLETITLKCLEKDPARRCASAQELADELGRFRRGDAIRARPASALERGVKWMRRRPSLAALLAVAALAVVLLLGGGLWYHGRLWQEYHRAEREREEARKRFQQALEAMDEIVAAVEVADPAHLDPVRRKLLARAQAYYSRLVEEKGDDEATRHAAGQAYTRLADVQALQGNWTDAELAYRAALGLLQETRSEGRDRRDLVRCYTGYGRVLKKMNRFTEAEAVYRRALELREKMVEEMPGKPEPQRELAETQYFLAALLAPQGGRRDEAEKLYTRALEVQHRLSEAFPDRPEYQREYARTLNNHGILLHTAGHREAEGEFRRAIELQQELVKRDPLSSVYRWELARSRTNLAVWQEDQVIAQRLAMAEEEALASYRAAEQQYTEAQHLLAELAAAFPLVPVYRDELSSIHVNRGRLLAQRQRAKEAEADYREALKLRQKLAEEFPNLPEYEHRLSLIQRTLGFLLAGSGQSRQAAEAYTAARKIQTKLAEAYPQVLHYQADLGNTLNGMARLHYAQGDLAEAQRLGEEAVRRHQTALEGNRTNLAWCRSLRDDYVILTSTLLHSGRHAAAALLAEKLPGALPAERSDERREEYLRAAQFLAECVPVALRDGALPEARRKQVAEEYGRRTVQLLQEAVKLGFRDVQELRQAPAYEPLRQREDFQALVRELAR